VPIGLAGMVLVTFLIENTRELKTRPLDWLGFVLSGVSLASILYSLDLASHGTLGDSIGFVALLAAGLAIGVAAVRHARRTPHPLIRLQLLRLPTFSITTWGGIFWRVSAGSIPFLLPVFLQVGLGMTAFLAGVLILADAVGNIAMNAVAPMTIRRFGFRTVLVYNGFISACCLAGNALFGAATPLWVIFTAYLGFGFMRSLQYNALSTLQYAEIPTPEMSAATSFASMMQQLCTGAGIAVGAVLLQLALTLRGAEAAALDADDLRAAFIVVALFALGSIFFFRRLRLDAGAEVSGHRVTPPAAVR